MAKNTKDIQQIINDFSQDLDDSVKYSYHVSHFIENEPSIRKTEISLDNSPKKANLEEHHHNTPPPLPIIEEDERYREISFRKPMGKVAAVVENKSEKQLSPPPQQKQPVFKKKVFNVDRPRTYMDGKEGNVHFVAPKKVTQVLSMTQSLNQVTLAEKNFRASRKITQKLESLPKDFFIHKIKDAQSNKVLTIQEEQVHNSEYNPYLVPYRLDLAILHGLATKFGLEDEDPDELRTEEKELRDILKTEKASSVISLTGLPSECPCCFESIEKRKANICFNSHDVRFLGHSFPLYMNLVKALIILVLIPFLLLVMLPHGVYLKERCDEKGMSMQLWTFCEPIGNVLDETSSEHGTHGSNSSSESSHSSSDSSTDNSTSASTNSHSINRLLSSSKLFETPLSIDKLLNSLDSSTNSQRSRMLTSDSTTNATNTESNTSTHDSTTIVTPTTNITSHDVNGSVSSSEVTNHSSNSEAEKHAEAVAEEIMVIHSYLYVIEKRLTFDIIFLIYFAIIVTTLRVYGLRYIRKHNRGTSIGQFTVLVKNLPFDSEEDEIRDFFLAQPLNYERSWLNRKLGLEDNMLPEDTKIEIAEINYVYNFADLIGCNKKIMSLIKTRRKLLSIYSNIKGDNAKFIRTLGSFQANANGSILNASFKSSFQGALQPISGPPNLIQKQDSKQESFDGNIQENGGSFIAEMLTDQQGPDPINELVVVEEKKDNLEEKKDSLEDKKDNIDSFQSNYTKNTSLVTSELRRQVEHSNKSFIWEKLEAGTLYLEKHLKAVDQELISQHDLQMSIIKSLKENTSKELGIRFCGQVFISFTNAKVARKMVQIFRAIYDPRKRKFRGKNRLNVEPAANPEEIIWENLGIYSHKKLYIRLLTFTMEILMLALTTYIVFIIYNKAESEETLKECGIAILVLTINKLFMKLISHLVEHERHKTKATVEALVVMFTLPLTLVNILVFELIEYGQVIVTRECITPDEGGDIWELGKIMHKLLFVNIFVCVGEPLLGFLCDYQHFVRLYHRFWIKRTRGYKNYCQEEVNKIFEGSEIELHEFYSQACIGVSVSMFAAPFFPPSILICIVGLFVNYWILKYNMLYRCKVESHQCNQVIGYFLLLVNLGPVFYMVSLFCISFYSIACQNETNADTVLFEKYEIVCLTVLVFLVMTVFKWFRPLIFFKLDVKQKSLGELRKEKGRTYDHLKSLLKFK